MGSRTSSSNAIQPSSVSRSYRRDSNSAAMIREIIMAERRIGDCGGTIDAYNATSTPTAKGSSHPRSPVSRSSTMASPAITLR